MLRNGRGRPDSWSVVRCQRQLGADELLVGAIETEPFRLAERAQFVWWVGHSAA